jgi:hypothetical protein
MINLKQYLILINGGMEMSKIIVKFEEGKQKFRVRIKGFKGEIFGPTDLTVCFRDVEEFFMSQMIGVKFNFDYYRKMKGKNVSNEIWDEVVENLKYVYVLDKIIHEISTRVKIPAIHFNFEEFEELQNVEVNFKYDEK